MMATRRDFQLVRGLSVPHSAVHMPIATQKLRTVRGQRLADVVILDATQDLRGVALDIRFLVSMSQASPQDSIKTAPEPRIRIWNGVCRLTLILLIFVSFGRCVCKPPQVLPGPGSWKTRASISFRYD